MRRSCFCLSLGLLWAGLVGAAELILPSTVLERDAPVTATFRTGRQAIGKGTLAIRWTDVHGRVVEERTLPVELKDESEFRFPLDLRRAVGMRNEVKVHFSFEGTDRKNARDHREEDAAVSFIARPPERRWQDYSIIMWQPHTPQQFAALKTIGINGGQYRGGIKNPPEFLLENDLRWYVENMATDYYAEYHRYRTDRIQHWSFLHAKEIYRKDPTSLEAFKRHPSFSDPAWQAKIKDRLVDIARNYSPYRPFFYDLADESGIADLASFWDFDFSDLSLEEMRAWLKERYGTLAALNQQWGTGFESWETVVPDTTNKAMKRADDNFSAWADHKEWMDISYARAIGMGRDAVHSVDPDAYVAIAGGQMPGWGGYDYYRLGQVMDAIEAYDIGNNVEILRSVSPGVVVVTTAFAKGKWEQHRIWYEWLHGARGNLIWDEAEEMAGKDNAIRERGQEVKPYYQELRGGLGALLINSVRQSDPVAIHYSQASMRTEWMLAHRPQGEDWVKRGSAIERLDSDFLKLRESYCKLLEDQGLQYKFVAYGQLEQGELLKGGYRVLILPRSSSLSEAEARAIREFAQAGGLVISDGDPGTFDEHSRRLPASRLEGVKLVRVNNLDYYQQRLMHKEGPAHQAMAKLISGQGVKPAFAALDAAGQPLVGVETHTFRNGGVTLVGLLNNPELRVNELGPPDFKTNQTFEKAYDVRLKLPAEMFAYDVRTGQALGRRGELAVKLNPYEPALFALSPAALPELRLAVPERLQRGETARLGVSLAAASPATNQVYHVDVTDPSGKLLEHYCGNVVAPGGSAVKLLPLAVNDPSGRWTIRVKDVLSGQVKTASVEVN